MSRIHEALKKAEQERAAVQAVSTDILTATSVANPPSQGPLAPDTGSHVSIGCRQGDSNYRRLPPVR